MGLPAEERRYSIQEYLDMEEKATERHEYHDGEVLAMSGGTLEHSRINTNLHISLGSALKGKPCFPLDSNMRVRIPGRGKYLYADTIVVCGRPEFDADDIKRTTILNPRVVIEVLSESTESYDRGAKFDLYREIPSMKEYVLVSQREPLVETFLRQDDGGWLMHFWKGLDSSAILRSLEISLPLRETYQGVEFSNPPEAGPPDENPREPDPSRKTS